MRLHRIHNDECLGEASVREHENEADEGGKFARQN